MQRLFVVLASTIVVMSVSVVSLPAAGQKMTQGEANAACKAAVQGRNGGGTAAYMACVRRKMAGQD
jgi:hypothetical protein